MRAWIKYERCREKEMLKIATKKNKKKRRKARKVRNTL